MSYQVFGVAIIFALWNQFTLNIRINLGTKKNVINLLVLCENERKIHEYRNSMHTFRANLTIVSFSRRHSKGL